MTSENVQADNYYRDLEIIGFDGMDHLTIDGFNAVIRRVGGQHLCGYVEVPDGLDMEFEAVIDCHGGVTFDGDNISFFPTQGRYIGFDCAHATDWNPTFWQQGTYKDVGFVLGEIWKMIKQLKEMNEG